MVVNLKAFFIPIFWILEHAQRTINKMERILWLKLRENILPYIKLMCIIIARKATTHSLYRIIVKVTLVHHEVNLKFREKYIKAELKILHCNVSWVVALITFCLPNDINYVCQGLHLHYILTKHIMLLTGEEIEHISFWNTVKYWTNLHCI